MQYFRMPDNHSAATQISMLLGTRGVGCGHPRTGLRVRPRSVPIVTSPALKLPQLTPCSGQGVPSMMPIAIGPYVLYALPGRRVIVYCIARPVSSIFTLSPSRSSSARPRARCNRRRVRTQRPCSSHAHYPAQTHA